MGSINNNPHVSTNKYPTQEGSIPISTTLLLIGALINNNPLVPANQFKEFCFQFLNALR